MAVEAARIVINIDTNAKQASGAMRSLGKSTRGASESAGGASKAFRALKNIGIAAIAVQGARALGRLAGELVSVASNAEETANKFGVTFRGIQSEAQAAAQSLADNFGLAQDQAQGLLADTGDLLTGFGFTRESALDLSTQVNELAVDLASFTNFSGGAEGASQALTKALLGERESLKSLGIAITEADIQRLAEDKGIVGELTRQQKAALTLELAMEQSGNAIGDFERSQASFANQTRIAEANIRDQKVALGSALLPIANIAVTTFNNMAGQMTETANRVRDFITSAQGATQIGEIFGFIGGVFRTVFDIGRELFEIGFGIWEDTIQSLRETFIELFGDTENTGAGLEILGGAVEGTILGFKIFAQTVVLAIDALGDIINIAQQSAQALGAIGQVVRGEISFEELKSEFAEVGQGFQDLGQNVADNFANIVDTAQQGIANFGRNSRDRAADIREAFNQTNESVSRNVTSALQNARQESQETADTTRDLAESAQESADAQEGLTSQLGATAEAAGLSAEEIMNMTSAQDEAADAARQLREQVQEQQSNMEQLAEIRARLAREHREQTMDRVELIEFEKEQELARAESLGASRDLMLKIEESYNAKILEATVERNQRVFEENQEARQKEIEAEREAAKLREGIQQNAEQRFFEQTATRIQLAEQQRDAEIAAAEDAGAETLAIREYYANQIRAIQRDQIVDILNLTSNGVGAIGDLWDALAERQGESAREAAERQKAFSIVESLIATAVAVTQALPNIPLAATVAALGAVQTAAIIAQPLPQAQFGGSFTVPPGNNQDSGLLRVNSGERVDVSPARSGDGGPLVVKLQLGDREFVQVVEDVFNRKGGQIRNARAVRTTT